MGEFRLLPTCQGGVQKQWGQVAVPSWAAEHSHSTACQSTQKIQQQRGSLHPSGRYMNALIHVGRYLKKNFSQHRAQKENLSYAEKCVSSSAANLSHIAQGLACYVLGCFLCLSWLQMLHPTVLWRLFSWSDLQCSVWNTHVQLPNSGHQWEDGNPPTSAGPALKMYHSYLHRFPFQSQSRNKLCMAGVVACCRTRLSSASWIWSWEVWAPCMSKLNPDLGGGQKWFTQII